MNPYGPFTLPYLPPFDDSWKQHCLSCAHCVATEGRQEGGGYRMLTCSKARYRTPCIEARSVDGTCGPEARGWAA
jgi:hypothetical protein